MSMEKKTVPIGKVRCHPDNARIGDHDRIASSLKRNGQYRPLTVQRSTGYILKGNNTYRVMKKLGFTEVVIVLVDYSDTQALEIVLADNAASDKSYTDMSAVTDLVATLPTIEGTGMYESELYLPDIPLEAVAPMLEPDGEEGTPDLQPPADKLPTLAVGRAKAGILPAAFTDWRRLMPRKKDEAVERLLELLGVTVDPEDGEAFERRIHGDAEDVVAIDQLIPHPKNPQQGDDGLVAMLLEAHGQYSPVIANRATNHILGGHTLTRAAKRLGYREIGVNWVDVPEEDEPYILIADNATAAAATYDQDKLGQMLAKLGHITRTGLELEDIEALLAGQSLRPAGQSGNKIKIQVGTISVKISFEQFRTLKLEPGEELDGVARLVGLSVADIRR